MEKRCGKFDVKKARKTYENLKEEAKGKDYTLEDKEFEELLENYDDNAEYGGFKDAFRQFVIDSDDFDETK
jgi:hypothetical protein